MIDLIKYINCLTKTSENKSLIIWIVVIVSVLVLLVALAIVLNMKVFFPKKVKKEVSDLSRKYEYLHASLINQDSMKVKHLEVIARTNLLYGEQHSQFNIRLKELKSKHDNHVNNVITQLRDYIMDNQFKEAHLYVSEVKMIMKDFEEKVNSFENDINAVIKPGEDAKQAIVEPQEKYRKCKGNYNELGDEISSLKETFDKVFSKIDEYFNEYEAYVESAHYDEANELFPTISQMVNELDLVLKVVPNYCASIIKIIPDKLRNLKRTYNNLSDEGYPLTHLGVKSFADSSDISLKQMLSKLKNLDIKGVQENINNILSKIDELFEAFEKEKEAKLIYERDYKDLETLVSSLSKRFTKLYNTVPEIRKVYVLKENADEELNELQNQVSNIQSVKRTLDTYVHSYSMQPYSVIVEKMNELNTLSNSINEKLDAFKQYLDSLKTDSQDAYSSLFVLYTRTKKAERVVREASISSFTEKYERSIQEIYATLDKVYEILKVLPIDVAFVNENMQNLKKCEDEVIYKIEQEYNELQVADATILYSNRHRGHLNDVDTLLDQAEELYFKGEFEQAYLKACDAEKLVEDSKETENKR